MGNEENATRRQFLKAIGATSTVTALAGCTNLPGMQSKLEKQLAEVRKQVKPYNGKPHKAIEDGYSIIEGPAVPGLGWCFVNKSYLKDAAKNEFTRAKPQVLLYDSEFTLGGVQYNAPNKATRPREIFAYDDATTAGNPWALHKSSSHILATVPYDKHTPKEELTFDDYTTHSDWLELYPKRDIKPGDEVTADFPGSGGEKTRIADHVMSHPDMQTLVVWLFEDNPNGTFEHINPNFAQEFPSYPSKW